MGTGFVVPGGRTKSALVNDPFVVAGGETPPTELIVKVGRFMTAGVLETVTGPEVGAEEKSGELVPVKLTFTASSRIRPSPAG
jgi:hypothetical protein